MNYLSTAKSSVDLIVKSAELRKDIAAAIHRAGKGHIGGAYSIVDILVSLYYTNTLNHRPNDPHWAERDRFILSKGHSAVALYAVLADRGYFNKEALSQLNQGGLLAEHPDSKIPGIEVLSGSLGHGLSIGSGMALADKYDEKNRKTFVLMGDGECYEGSVWEAAIFASHHKLRNLCGIVDRNKLITHGSTEEINRLEPFADKWRAFGWRVIEVNAHDFQELASCWEKFSSQHTDMPTLVVANSTKGKGISFMENEAAWHHGGITSEILEKINLELAQNVFIK
jgi:transketolase